MDDAGTGSPSPGDEERWPRRRVLRWACALAALAAVTLVLLWGANRPADPHLAARAARTPVAGFGEVAFRVGAGGSASRCALVADTQAQQEQGLMNRTDLSGYDGMLFRFPADTSVQFYMKDTPMPLSIAWFDSSGRFVSSSDMEPCLGTAQCPLFSAAAPYRDALEVAKGGLGTLGIGPGAHLTVGGACP
ncbi:MAG: DUF192 domain-containing protein [Acidimicrobiales bacterium]